MGGCEQVKCLDCSRILISIRYNCRVYLHRQMQRFTITELICFDAVAREGSFQAAAAKLHRTHPSVFAAVGKLERQAGLRLLDRTSYRVCLTDVGKSFHRQAKKLLRDLDALNTLAAQLAMGEETDLRVVIGDLCPLPETLGLLNRF